MTRQRETRAVNLRSGDPWETVSLTTLSRDRKIFPVLLSEARDIAVRQQEGKLVVYTAWGVEWRPFGKARSRRPLPSVVLAPGQSERIQQDVKSFMERRQWYADRGNPLSSGLSFAWTSWLWKIIFYPSPRWRIFLRYIYHQSV